MNRPVLPYEFDRTVDEVAGRFAEAAGDALAWYCELLEFLSGPPEDGDGRSVTVSVAEAEHLLRAALTPELRADVQAFADLGYREADRWRNTLVATIDVVEELVQAAERRYGSRRGHGPLKRAEVKAILARIVGRFRLDLGILPRYVAPLIADVVAGVLCDVVVEVLNEKQLWVEAPVRRVGVLQRTGRGVVSLRDRVARAVAFALARLATWIWYATRRRVNVPKEFAEALDRLDASGLVVDQRDAVRSAVGFFVWIGERGSEFVALFDLVIMVVEEAERYEGLSGPEKRRYALDLVTAVLERLGLEVQAGVGIAVVQAATGTAIDSVVRIFNKRGHFR